MKYQLIVEDADNGEIHMTGIAIGAGEDALLPSPAGGVMAYLQENHTQFMKDVAAWCAEQTAKIVIEGSGPETVAAND